MAHIIVVEDEQELARLIASTLKEDGHTIEVYRDGQFALDRIQDASAAEPDLYILDLGLPRVDGLTLCKRIRQNHITPIVMLTAKSSELDKVLGLELGADDYITKPVSLRELQARVAAILRRVEMMANVGLANQDAAAIEQSGLRIDPVGREVEFNRTQIALTAKEFDLLYLLASNPGRVFSRNYLLDNLWGDTYTGFERTVDTHIQRLRRKLSVAEGVDERIVTLWGVGYKYEKPDTVDA
ncbi:MAG: response regulator transcription factor [Thermomicrobiales bacterium]|nr:response regulator transcription factor [Thermomicrobiales bacterium]MCO5225135.1 response regulator transcription factor [Thermomicrobiales bacterium]